MGQNLSSDNEKLIAFVKSDGTPLTTDEILSGSDGNDNNVFLCSKYPTDTTSSSIESTSDNLISNFERQLIPNIQNQISLLTNGNQLKNLNNEIHANLMENIFKPMGSCFQQATYEIQAIYDKQEQLQASMARKLDEEKKIAQGIFIESEGNESEIQEQQLSHSATESFSSMLLLLIKSAEKHDPSIIHQVITLTSQLCENIPVKYLSPINQKNNFLFKSLMSVTNYINQLAPSTDLLLKKETMKILLSFALAKASLKEILPMLYQLIFNNVDISNVKNLFTRLNNGLKTAVEQSGDEQLLTIFQQATQTDGNQQTNEDTNSQQMTNSSSTPVSYLMSIGAFPNVQMMKLEEKQLTGPFISSVILAHIDLDNKLNANNQFDYSSIVSTISFDLDPNTFKELFQIIEQLTIKADITSIEIHILTVLLRLLTTHLRFLCSTKSNIVQVLSTTTIGKMIKSSIKSNKDIDSIIFLTPDDLQKWFDILSKLAFNNNEQFKATTINEEASKALIYIIDQKCSSFIDKLSFIHKYIIENKHPVFAKELIFELNRNITLLRWIELLSDNDQLAFTILYSFIDIILNPSNETNEEFIKQIEQILKSFQHLLFTRLVPEFRLTEVLNGTSDYVITNDVEPSAPAPLIALASKLVLYVLNMHKQKIPNSKKLFDSILVNLCLMTDTEKLFNFATLQPIFIDVLPLLAEYILENINKDEAVTDHLYYVYWLVGKMCNIMITGSQQDSIEKKYVDKPMLSLFAGGCEKIIIDKNKSLSNLLQSNLASYCKFKWANQNHQPSSDYEFLMSIYNNTDQGAELISKMKLHMKNKPHSLQKSIEQQANDACAAVFAVYLKYFRRINLAKDELTRSSNRKPYHKLASIFEYANYVYILFSTTKGQGGDCNELYKQIKMNTLFLLSSIKESQLIPIIGIDETLSEINEEKIVKSQEKYSRWKKEKYALRLVRNIFDACIRFKKMMLARKRMNQHKQNDEYLLHQILDEFISKTILSSTNENLNFESEEIILWMSQQYQRATTRLITYQFISTFIEKIFQTKNREQALIMLSVCLPYLKSTDFENIQTANDDLKEEIGNSYYSIIKTILMYILNSESTLSIRTVFHLLNFSYQQTDICRLYQNQFVEILFERFVSFQEKSNGTVSVCTKFAGYNWFRLYVLKLCKYIETEKEQGEFVFKKLILNELKELKRLKQNDSISDDSNSKNRSLKNAAIGWFIQATTTDTKLDIELCTNQLLMLLLRCLNSYESVRSYCATIDYIEEFLYLYHKSQNNITILLSLKILRNLLPLLPDDINGTSKIIMNNLLDEILHLIGDSFISEKLTPEIVTELIYIYRTIISIISPWQSMATQLILDTILSIFNSKSFENIESKQMNKLLSSLCILGGYIYPYCSSSTVQVYPDDELNNETQLAVIIDVDQNALLSGSTEALPYLIQYSQTNKTQQVNADKLRIEIDVSPPNLLTLPNFNENLNTFFDVLISFIEIDTSTTESLLLLQLKRRSIATLYRVLNTKKLVDIFIEKPYASIIAKLSTSDLLSKANRQPVDLRLSNKQHLEQYSLSLDRYERSKQIIDNGSKDYASFIRWNDHPIKQDHLAMDLLSTNLTQDYQWKSNASKRDIQLFKRGRIGNDDIQIVPMPSTVTNTWFLEDCGISHRFPGRTYLISETADVSMTTFIVDNLRLSEGKWYYCVRLLEGTSIQIGWATTGFTPSNSVGIGNDKYSWSYDGSQNKLFNNEQYSFLREDLHWRVNDVCGCGIEICNENIRITYWINGHFFGTAFAHQSTIGATTTNCDMLPNGPGATYFPGITLKTTNYSMSSCEFIFSPEDMYECPLPKGYKPLLLPTVVNIEHAFVPYPANAYLIGDNIQTRGHVKPKRFLRDLVNDQHLENLFSFDNHRLVLEKESNGFPLKIDHNGSLTISFDLEILTNLENIDIPLLTFDTPDVFSIRIPFNRITQQTRIAVVFDSNTRQTTVYIDNEYLILETPIITKYNLHILPKTAIGIKNFGIWKYSLSQECIRRLFIYGLPYVTVDYHRLENFRKQMNTFTFNKNQKYFSTELLVPFNEPFDENKWEKKKIEADEDESKYFKVIEEMDQSTIQLFGNRTYLVLDKSVDSWSEYTLILDILISNLPKNNEQITLVSINNSQLEVFIANDGHVCLSNGIKSQSKLKLNEYIRLLISVEKKTVKIHANGLLAIDETIDDDHWIIKDKRIDLFRETDLTKNTIDEDTPRIKCKSITYLNKATSIIDENMKSSKYSLENLVTLPYSIIAPSLLLIGYSQSSIKSVIKQNITGNIQLIDTLLREKSDVKERPIIKEDILSKLSPLIDQQKLKEFINFSQLETDQVVHNLSEIMFVDRNVIQTSSFVDVIDKDEVTVSDKKWFYQTVRHLDINDSLTDWMRDKSVSADGVELNYQLLDLNRPVQEQTIIIEDQQKQSPKSIQYSHQQLTNQQYSQSRIACEQELISIYAHYTILNILRIWSNDASQLFPLEKFGDCAFIVTLLRLLDYHYTYRRLNTDETIDRMSLLAASILKVEINELLKHETTTTNNQITTETLQQKAPLLCQLQKDFIIQWIRFLSSSSVIVYDYDDETTSITKQSNFKFILKIFQLFTKLLTDQTIKKQNEIDFLVPILFPELFINLLFDLFLLSHSHQTKIFILHLFSTLIQTSKNFNLNKHIQYFLFELFVELPPNPTSRNSRIMKTFQITVMDIVYLLIERQQYQQKANNLTSILNKPSNTEFDFDFTRFSSNFSDILIAIDVINALKDKTKQILFPEAFLLKSNLALDDKYKFTQDDVEKSSSHFDVITDQQLIRYINNHPLINSSIPELINSLPKESEPNPTHYKTYPSLLHIPANYIQIRARLIHQFNLFIENIISIIDFSLLPGQSILTDRIREGRSYILHPIKFQLLQVSLANTEAQVTTGIPAVNFDTIAASASSNRTGTHTMFNQAYEQLNENAHLTFRLQADRLWLAQYLGMHSTDQGGPYRDSITRMCSDICSTRLTLFILCPNGRTNSGLNRDRWIPNVFPPNRSILNKIKKQYRFVGQLMGLAIRRKHYLDLKFPNVLWKQLVREPITLEDIEAIDSQGFSMINEMEKNIKQIEFAGNNNEVNDLFSSIMDELRFEVVSSSGETFELVPGGKDIPITANNFKEYCNYYREYRLNEFRRQIEFIRQGLFSVVPGYFLSLFTSGELEEAVCGKGDFDVELLKRNTSYGGEYNADSPCIQQFWTVINDMLNEEQKKLFLIFVWGRCTLPSRDEDFVSKFVINPYDLPSNEVNGALPRSHTCTFTIDLPQYSAADIMYERLNYAITYCSSIDGDGMMNTNPVRTEFDSD